MCPAIPTALSPQALRILSHSCDSEIDNPDTPLALWDTLEKEVRHGYSPIPLFNKPSGTPESQSRKSLKGTHGLYGLR